MGARCRHRCPVERHAAPAPGGRRGRPMSAPGGRRRRGRPGRSSRPGDRSRQHGDVRPHPRRVGSSPRLRAGRAGHPAPSRGYWHRSEDGRSTCCGAVKSPLSPCERARENVEEPGASPGLLRLGRRSSPTRAQARPSTASWQRSPASTSVPFAPPRRTTHGRPGAAVVGGEPRGGAGNRRLPPSGDYRWSASAAIPCLSTKRGRRDRRRRRASALRRVRCRLSISRSPRR